MRKTNSQISAEMEVNRASLKRVIILLFESPKTTILDYVKDQFLSIKLKSQKLWFTNLSISRIVENSGLSLSFEVWYISGCGASSTVKISGNKSLSEFRNFLIFQEVTTFSFKIDTRYISKYTTFLQSGKTSRWGTIWTSTWSRRHIHRMHIERDIHHEICPQIFAVIQENTEISFNFDARYINEYTSFFQSGKTRR